MKTPSLILAAAALVAVSAVAFTQDQRKPAAKDLEARVRLLEEESVKSRELLAETLRYLEAQSEQSKELLKALDRAESLGFTKGMNYESREALLVGLRAYLRRQQQSLPQAPRTQPR